MGHENYNKSSTFRRWHICEAHSMWQSVSYVMVQCASLLWIIGNKYDVELQVGELSSAEFWKWALCLEWMQWHISGWLCESGDLPVLSLTRKDIQQIWRKRCVNTMHHISLWFDTKNRRKEKQDEGISL